MASEYVLSNLCYYDLRNPFGIKDIVDEEDIKEDNLGEYPKKDCSCDNCFYGRTNLALIILNIIDKKQCTNQ